MSKSKSAASPALLALGLAASVALAAPEPSVRVGVVAQRYPWNGTVDVTCRVADAPKDAPLVVFANGVEVVRVAATNGEQKVSFDANKIDALKGKKLADVKVTAKVEGKFGIIYCR